MNTTSATAVSTTRKFDTPTPIAAVLDIPAGRLTFIATDRSDSTVEVRPADPDSARDAKAAQEITAEYGDGVLRIQAPAKDRPLGPSGSAEVTVHLPVGSRVEAKAAAAEVRTTGRLGEVAFEGAHGWIKLAEADSARLTLLAGDVQVGRLGGAAEISTGKGDIRIDQAVRGTLVLRTEHGAISVAAAAGVPARLNAGASYGRIHNALRNTEGAAELDIHATTTYGDITARSL
ncbi:DUF4097 domain-containing protein [Kitasatospora sp. NBC_01287]|uniref:DUF4097 family beta strand repeat-containing protein n=1 Tax=Kitasatospora sp. NBC_01287 TaxID=2903573 RepID=UPI002250D7FD|nr:DUF4097 family beta strand repeat-containing protein [Kitasatospora sp. NBC_01287]MCX4749782.1 DUF4097 domain-containing protein [Kitasatospora sp. NBC_01287]